MQEEDRQMALPLLVRALVVLREMRRGRRLRVPRRRLRHRPDLLQLLQALAVDPEDPCRPAMMPRMKNEFFDELCDRLFPIFKVKTTVSLMRNMAGEKWIVLEMTGVGTVY